MAGHIYDRGNGTYQVRVYLGRDEETGKRLNVNRTVRGDKKDAERVLHELLHGRDSGQILAPPARETVAGYLAEWLELGAKPRLGPRTYQDYDEKIRLYIRPHIGKMKLARLDPLDIQGLYSKLQAQGLSARTIRYVHVILQSALKQAVLWRLIHYNPAQSTAPPRMPRGEKKAKVFNPEQACRFLEAAARCQYRMLWTFALATGMRPEEYLALAWEAVDLASGVVQVRRVLVRDRKAPTAAQREAGAIGWQFCTVKTQAGRRSIALPRTVHEELKRWRTTVLERRLAAGDRWTDHDLVFPGERGQPLDGHNLSTRYFKRVIEQAQLDRTFRLYDLRHSCATLMLLQKVDPKIVSERMGHSSSAFTMDTYQQVLSEMERQAADQLEVLLFRPR